MAQPAFVVPLRIVDPAVGAAALGAAQGRRHGRQSQLHQVFQFQRLDAGGVEDVAVVFEHGVVETVTDLPHLGQPLLQHLLRAEHAAVLLHHLLQFAAQAVHRLAAVAPFPAGQPRQRRGDAVVGQRAVIAVLLQVIDDVVAGGAAEHHDVQQRIAAEAVGAVHRDAGALAHRIEPGDALLAVAGGHHHPAVAVGGDAAHGVVGGGIDRDRLLHRVDVEEGAGHVADRRQPLGDHRLAQVVELEQHVVMFRPAAAPGLHLGVDGAAHHVAAGQVQGVGRIALHEALAVAVDQITALAAHPFADQHPLAGDAGGMELEELHVLQRDAGAQRHRHAVAGVDVGVGVGAEQLAGAAAGDEGGLGLDDQRLAGLDLQHQRAEDVALRVAQQVDGEELVEEMGAGADVLLVEGVEDRMAGAVGRGTGARRLLAAEVLALAAEAALVDATVGQARERHAGMLQFDHQMGGGAAHIFDGVLVAQIVAALDGVVHVPVPVVRQHVGQGRVDAALGRHRVGAGGKHLGDHRHIGLRLGQLQRGAQTAAARADHQRIEAAPRHGHSSTCNRMRASQIASTSSQPSSSASNSNRAWGRRT